MSPVEQNWLETYPPSCGVGHDPRGGLFGAKGPGRPQADETKDGEMDR